MMAVIAQEMAKPYLYCEPLIGRKKERNKNAKVKNMAT